MRIGDYLNFDHAGYLGAVPAMQRLQTLRNERDSKQQGGTLEGGSERRGGFQPSWLLAHWLSPQTQSKIQTATISIFLRVSGWINSCVRWWRPLRVAEEQGSSGAALWRSTAGVPEYPVPKRNTVAKDVPRGAMLSGAPRSKTASHPKTAHTSTAACQHVWSRREADALSSGVVEQSLNLRFVPNSQYVHGSNDIAMPQTKQRKAMDAVNAQAHAAKSALGIVDNARLTMLPNNTPKHWRTRHSLRLSLAPPRQSLSPRLYTCEPNVKNPQRCTAHCCYASGSYGCNRNTMARQQSKSRRRRRAEATGNDARLEKPRPRRLLRRTRPPRYKSNSSFRECRRNRQTNQPITPTAPSPTARQSPASHHHQAGVERIRGAERS